MGRAALATALAVFLLAAAPAAAATHTLPVLPETAHGEVIASEQPVLAVRLRLPAGHVRRDSEFGLFWDGGSRRCPARAFVAAAATVKPVRLPRGLRRSHGSVLLHTAAGDRRAATTVFDGRGRTDLYGDGLVIQLELPGDLIPAYPRRYVYLVGGPFPSIGSCPERVARRAARVGRAAVRGGSITVPASYTPPPPLNTPKPLDVAASPGLVMKGAATAPRGAVPGWASGRDIAGAGDVNGDGLADAVVSSPYAGAGQRGIATVVFGRSGGGTVDLGRPGAAGFEIIGPSAGTFALPAAGLGDLDGDGLGDLVVGAPAADGGRGAAYVIRGSASNQPVDLGKPGARLLFKIVGGRTCRDGGSDNLGAAITAAGDMNGDGVPDVAVLVPHNCADRGGGGIYVVFGARSAQTVNVRRLGARGIVVPGDYEAQFANAVIAPAGDVNGDGLADLLLDRGDSGPGVPAAEIIPGTRAGGVVRLRRLRFVMNGHSCDDSAQWAAGAGDVNGDGLDDVVISAGALSCDLGVGVAYIVFGTRTPGRVDLHDLGARGITISGLPGTHFSGGVAGAGDVNGDGLADVAVADDDATVFGRRLAGEIFLVPGRAEPGTIDLRYAGDSVRAWGGPRGAGLGATLAPLGDFDGDGEPDLLAGAPRQRSEAGAAYVLPLP